jgi:hypothetical protein
MLQIAPRFGLLISPLRVHLSLSRHSQPRALHPSMCCLFHSSPGVRAQQSSPEAAAPGSPEKANAALDSELQIETVAASTQQRPNVQPLLYSQTKAAQWSAAKTFRRAPNPDRPWYQGYVIAFSFACFVIYLFVREENDLDEELRKPLWKRIPHLELQTLRRIVAEKRAHGESAEPELRRIEQLLKQHEGLKPPA